MSKQIKTPYVFIDTQVFDRLCHNYDHPDLETLVSLVEDGTIHVILTSITVGEIRAHIRDRITSAHRALKKSLGKHPILRTVTAIPFDELQSDDTLAKMMQEKREAFEAFMRRVQARTVSLDGASSEGVFQDYFAGRPPFGEGRKKEEFPDAFAAQALCRWCKESKQKLYAISIDKDWGRICDDSDALIHVPGLAAFLDKIPDARLVARLKAGLRKRWGKFKKELEEPFGQLGFYVEDAVGDVLQVRVLNATEISLFVVEAKDGAVRFEVECEVEFEADVSYQVPGTGSYDKEEDSIWYAEQEAGCVVNYEMVAAEITASYDAEDPEKLDDIDVSVVGQGTRGDIGINIDTLLT